jgi:polysaccharide export outer membrane protein
MRRTFFLSVCCLPIAVVLLQAKAFSIQKQSPPSQAQPAHASAADVTKDFVIGPEDTLSINVWREPELSVKEVVVRPDGKISIPLVSDIQASGFTPQQVQDKLAEKLKEFVASPVVTVTVIRISSLSVSIVGEVQKPGAYPLVFPMTVLELLARAGGVTLDAKAKKIKIIRKEGANTLQFPFNYKDVKNGKNLQSNIVLKNRDVVIVP